MKIIWKEVKIAVKEHIPGHRFKMWIEPLEFKEYAKGCVVLSTPNFFSKKRVLEHYGKLIKSELGKISGKEINLVIDVSNKKNGSKAKPDGHRQMALQNISKDKNNRFQIGRFLRNDFTFDKFVVGKNNDFAYSAALSIASKKDLQQNCLFLLSKTGMGKSHLSQAICHHVLSGNPSNRVCYITAEDFANEMVNAFLNGCINKFKEKYRNQCDVLLIDDVHYLTGKKQTQIELALALDYLMESNKKIIFTSTYLPGDIPKLNEKLRSRFASGIISNIEPPNFNTRVKILQKKSFANGHNIPEEIIRYLAGELTVDVRQLESGLIGVMSKSSLLGSPIDINLAESVVKNIVCKRKNITIDAIKKLVCKQYSISINEIVSKSRKQAFVRPRQVAIYLARKYTDLPLEAIGRSFNRYHATALHSISAVEKGVRSKAQVQRQVELICEKLESGEF